MARKPYITKQPSNWYMQSTFYKLYMLRELTSVPVILASLNLFWGIATLAASSPESWLSWIAFQKNPLIILLNLFAIVAAMYNTVEWYKAMPKAIRIQIGEKFVADKKMIIGSWVVFAVITLVILIITIVFA